MVKKTSISLTKSEFYEAIRLYVLESERQHMPMSSNDVTFDIKQLPAGPVIEFQWVVK
jgi:hypothetical protein